MIAMTTCQLARPFLVCCDPLMAKVEPLVLCMLLLLLFVVRDCTLISAVRAQVDQHERDINALTGICIHELTWSVEYDCEPIYQVMRARQERRGYASLEDAIRTQCRRFYHGTSRRPWARRVRPDIAVLPGWPRRWGPVSAHHASIDRVFTHTRAIVEGRVPTRCEVVPNHWGSRNRRLPDIHRAETAIRMGIWVEADCGPTIQGYYAVVAWMDRD